ncbi:MAG: hypothetical protein J2P37_29845 [Ktedonobacteraceae bacterium]|nr:hypothetical protein [Ktedonobacteraceae bacterium]MBO0791352.1 hypothetical protein [Ktedonobacteraceae bacterium]
MAHTYGGYDGFWRVGSHGEGMTVNLVAIDMGELCWPDRYSQHARVVLYCA